MIADAATGQIDITTTYDSDEAVYPALPVLAPSPV